MLLYIIHHHPSRLVNTPYRHTSHSHTHDSTMHSLISHILCYMDSSCSRSVFFYRNIHKQYLVRKLYSFTCALVFILFCCSTELYRRTVYYADECLPIDNTYVKYTQDSPTVGQKYVCSDDNCCMFITSYYFVFRYRYSLYDIRYFVILLFVSSFRYSVN